MTALPTSTGPRGPDSVRAALYEATERLCNDCPPATVTVRQIAAVAGVSHGLVHRYYGSKMALVAATMLHIEQEFDELMADLTDPVEAIETLFDRVNERPSYIRLLNWMLVEGVEPTGQLGEFPMVTRLTELLRTKGGFDDAAIRVQALLSFIAGWVTTHLFLADITELTATERVAATARARRLAVSIALEDS